MTPEETVAAVKDGFPNGAQIVTGGEDARTLRVVGLDPRVIDGAAQMLGWAYPNKDFYFDLSKVEVKDDAWIITDKGVQKRMTPLTKAQGDDIFASMEGA